MLAGGLALAGTAGCDVRSRAGGAPLFVLVGQNPWRLVLGSDAPTLAIYDDGVVIFQHRTGFKSVKLDASELEQLKQRLGFVTLPTFAKHYELVNFTDATTSIFYVFNGPIPAVISIYGPLRADVVSINGKVVDQTVSLAPEPLITAFDVANAFDHPRAKAWLPDRVEVAIWPYEYAPDASIFWPKKWPGLDHPTTVRTADGYDLYLPSTELPDLKRFLSSRRERGAIEIEGKKWSADLRYPFPKEEAWRKHAPQPRA